MDVQNKPELSKEIYNRILIWKEALQEAYFNLKVEEHLRKNFDNVDNDCNFELAGLPCFAHSSLTACRALVEMAVVLVRQIFSTGNAGHGIASNRGNYGIDQLRNEMENYVKEKLSWPDNEYADFYRLIRDRRNQFLAHYDGVAAEYCEPAAGISTMKMVGANLNRIERDKLEKLVKEMFEYIVAKIERTKSIC